MQGLKHEYGERQAGSSSSVIEKKARRFDPSQYGLTSMRAIWCDCSELIQGGDKRNGVKRAKRHTGALYIQRAFVQAGKLSQRARASLSE